MTDSDKTEREIVEQALSLLDELRNTAIPVARLREEMLKPAREYLKARLVVLEMVEPHKREDGPSEQPAPRCWRCGHSNPMGATCPC